MSSIIPVIPQEEVRTSQAPRVHDFSNPTSRAPCQLPGYLVPPRFSPPPPETEKEDVVQEDSIALQQPSHHIASTHFITTPSVTSLGSSSMPSQTEPSSVDANEPTPSLCNPSSCSSSSSESYSAPVACQHTREKIILAEATLQLPPGILEFIPPSTQNKYRNRIAYPSTQQHPGLTLSADHKYLSIRQASIVHAGMLNGLILSVDSFHLLDEDSISPFNSPNKPTNNLPPDLAPTALQKSIPHHPYIDIIPFPSFRDKLLRFADLDIINGDDMCELMFTGWTVWGSSPWDRMSWEIGDKFAEKYWFLVDKDMKRATDFWRGQRGEPPLKFHESWGRAKSGTSLKRGRILEEEEEEEQGGGGGKKR